MNKNKIIAAALLSTSGLMMSIAIQNTAIAKTSTQINNLETPINTTPTGPHKTATLVTNLNTPTTNTQTPNKTATQITLDNPTPTDTNTTPPVDTIVVWSEVENYIFNYVNTEFSNRGQTELTKSICLKKFSNLAATRARNNLINIGQPGSIDLNDTYQFLQNCGYNKQVIVKQIASIGTHDKAMMDNSILKDPRTDTGEAGFTLVKHDGWTIWIIVLSTS